MIFLSKSVLHIQVALAFIENSVDLRPERGLWKPSLERGTQLNGCANSATERECFSYCPEKDTETSLV